MVAVTDDGVVHCFTDQLELMWKVKIFTDRKSVDSGYFKWVAIVGYSVFALIFNQDCHSTLKHSWQKMAFLWHHLLVTIFWSSSLQFYPESSWCLLHRMRNQLLTGYCSTVTFHHSLKMFLTPIVQRKPLFRLVLWTISNNELVNQKPFLLALKHFICYVKVLVCNLNFLKIFSRICFIKILICSCRKYPYSTPPPLLFRHIKPTKIIFLIIKFCCYCWAPSLLYMSTQMSIMPLIQILLWAHTEVKSIKQIE